MNWLAQAICRKASSCLNHSPTRFQLAKIWGRQRGRGARGRTRRRRPNPVEPRRTSGGKPPADDRLSAWVGDWRGRTHDRSFLEDVGAAPTSSKRSRSGRPGGVRPAWRGYGVQILRRELQRRRKGDRVTYLSKPPPDQSAMRGGRGASQQACPRPPAPTPHRPASLGRAAACHITSSQRTATPTR
jgi:hypothetical protein